MESIFAIDKNQYLELSPERADQEIDLTQYKTYKLDSADEKMYLIRGLERIVVSSSESADIFVRDSVVNFTLTGDRLHIEKGQVFFNTRLSETDDIVLHEGDAIFFDGKLIIWSRDYLRINALNVVVNLQEYISDRHEQEEFPIFSRSARVIKREPDDTIDVDSPTAQSTPPKGGLLKTIVPPLVTVAGTITVGVLMGRGLFMYVMALSSIVTTCFSVTNYFSDKKERKEEAAKREARYNEYLLGKRKELNSKFEAQKEALLYQNLTAREIADEVEDNSIRLFERSSTDGDFLNVVVGTADKDASFKIKYKQDSFKDKDDPLEDEMRDICRRYSKVEDMPFTVDLKNSHLALIGEKRHIHPVIMNIVSQLAFFQSYHDIEIVTLIDPEYRKDFEWMRWYPHCRIKSINITGIIDSESIRDQVLGNLAQVLKGRKERLAESASDSSFLPYYIFIVDNPKLVLNHAIMEYLQSPDLNLGFRIIYLSNLESNVPENIKTTVIVNNLEEGKVRLYESELMNKELKMLSNENVDFERIARRTTPIIHHKGISSHIPESISFFELYNIKKPQDLDLPQIWSQNACYKSLSVPIGVRGENDIVSLNLHEKAHGPHGLIAGTTGSGKSELIQSYILSLAFNFSPYEVGFLLIDYKGGGMANLFSDLPHLLGTITNLDGSESMRALASIKAELSRRQRIFFEHDINNINQYSKMFRAGEVKEPLPHLFIISDEFAELKKEQPEFMTELVSTARIGRSLGVHLILATQKPGGIVDDQIWSNSKFKIALKVQTESDSKDVIKTSDAAYITETGRAYLQVGNNEIYELFQSAWSGAPYREQEAAQGFDSRVYQINRMGQGALINEDLSEGVESNDTRVTQLDVLVNYIRDTYEKIPHVEVMKPWLPPLEESIVNEDIVVRGDVGSIETIKADVALGLVDMPDLQIQKDYIHDFYNDGNMAVFASSGFGKSTLLTNMALSLACNNSPRLLNFYILDFGNSALIPLKKLPHTADYMTFDEEEKRNKLTAILTREIKERKSKFARTGSINFKMYNMVATEKLPMIIVVIDNFDAVKEAGMEYESFIASLCRDGVGLGIYTVVTASRAGAIRYSVLNSFKHKIVLYLYDSMDSVTLIGRSKIQLPEVKGRALVKDNEINVMQCYTPVKGNDDIDYINKINAIVDEIAKNNTAPKLKGIPVLPEIVTSADLTKNKSNSQLVPIGLESESVESVYINAGIRQLIVGGPKTGKTTIIKAVVSELTETASIYIFDSSSGDLMGYANKYHYYSSPADAEKFYKDLCEESEKRKTLYETQGKGYRREDFFRSLPPAVLLIDDVDHFISCFQGNEKAIGALLRDFELAGIGVVYTTIPNKLRGFEDMTKVLKEVDSGIVLGKPSEQMFLPVPNDRTFQPQITMGYLVEHGSACKVKLLSPL